jgi:peptidoglycan hydrolase-like protein with peptidoglycan-binding domain
MGAAAKITHREVGTPHVTETGAGRCRRSRMQVSRGVKPVAVDVAPGPPHPGDIWLMAGEGTVPGSISPWPVVRKGNQDHPIKTLQYLLRARGHTVTVDGAFGPRTEAAVKAFQASKGLADNGIVGPETWTALVIRVQKGSHGDAVRGVQEEFQFRNLSGDPSKGLKVDGDFGPKTDAAVRGFQHALSLDIPSVAVDGIVGPVTWQALVSGMLSG